MTGKRYQKRWFVLNGSTIFYFEKPHEDNPLALIPLQGASVSVLTAQPNHFRIVSAEGNRARKPKTKGKGLDDRYDEWILRCEGGVEEVSIWLDCLVRTLENFRLLEVHNQRLMDAMQANKVTQTLSVARTASAPRKGSASKRPLSRHSLDGVAIDLPASPLESGPVALANVFAAPAAAAVDSPRLALEPPSPAASPKDDGQVEVAAEEGVRSSHVIEVVLGGDGDDDDVGGIELDLNL